MKSFASEAMTTFAARVAVILLAVATQSCLAWQLGPASRGIYAICLVFAGIAKVFGEAGTDVAIQRQVASREATVGEGLASYLLVGFVAGLIALAAIPVAYTIAAGALENIPYELLLLTCATIPAVSWTNSFASLFSARRRFGQFAMVSVFNGVVLLVLVYISLALLHQGVAGALWSLIITAFIGCPLMCVLHLRSDGSQLSLPSYLQAKRIIDYGLRYLPGKLSNLANVQIGTILLAFMADERDVGLFAVVALLASRLEFIPDTMGMVIFARVAENGVKQAALATRCGRLSAMVCGAFAIILAIFATPVVRLLFSEAFVPAAPLLQILCIGVVVRSGAKIYAHFLLANNRPGSVSIAVACGTIVNFLLLVVLLPRIGLPGAAWATVGCHLVSSAIIVRAFLTVSHSRASQLFMLSRSDIRALVVPLLSVADLRRRGNS